MVLNVISHIRTINETGVWRNETIKIYFNKPIEPSTITWDTFSLNDTESFSSCVGTLAPIWASGINLSGVTSGLAFTPTITLLPNTEYSVYVYAAPNSVIAKDKSELSDTYSYSFITGTGYYDSTGVTAGVPSGVPADAYDITLSGILDSEESSITSFTVYKTIPKNQTPNVSGSTIQVYFTGNILTSSGDIGNYITLTEEPVL
jgi:hypothetical protein